MTRPSARVVFVVDDSEALGRMLVEVLERNGYRARWIASGEEAMEAVREAPPDVVLLDLNLGDMEGVELARTLRALPQMKGVRIIGLSGDPVPPRGRAALDKFLLKPVTSTTLLGALRR